MGSKVSTFDILTADVKTLQGLLSSGNVTSKDLINLYLAQIAKHDGVLHAMIDTAPKDSLLRQAHDLDVERQAGNIRGPLHGIPVIDNIATHPSLGLGTRAGSLALVGSKPRKSATILIRKGAIILGKSNLSEFANWRGVMLISGWSGVGGQVQSAYVRGGILYDDGKDGHSNPSGSSSGSAVAVSAGYAPVSIGTESDGSLICPAGRAALYTIKPTIGLVPQDGIVPASELFDTAGPMTKSVYDLAVLLDAISDPGVSFTSNLTSSWEDISVATLDPRVWKFPGTFIKPVPQADEQALRDITDAYRIIKVMAKRFVENVPLTTIGGFYYNGEISELTLVKADMKRLLNNYLEDLEESKVRSLQEIIDFNKAHAKEELPPLHDNQEFFIQTEQQDLSEEQYNKTLEYLRTISRDHGIDYILRKFEVDVIIGPADSFITSLAAASGTSGRSLPSSRDNTDDLICRLPSPLSYLDFNGRPLGVAALAGKNQDATLIKLMSAWEATFPKRKPPPQLVE
ncbi:putative glutamyl-tRNA amidotransferase subunit A [Hypoxylon rubiginosum]|uniref:Glutamyl-tRNA amidotransferase subunit A n=1 Tax=Hypoxylon rubiginosum TaxID=110542 RepID=A0ACC0CRF7_9PEZI|nr:putative glutamyl-tRNA amidotransferase subunit A [Hypoxylon rubiginosum]